MTALACVEYDVLRDSRHRDAAAAGEQRDWLSWLELGGTRPRTLYDYEWSTAVMLRMFPATSFAEFSDTQVMAALRAFPPSSRRVRAAAYRSWFKWGRLTKRLVDNPMELVPDIRQAPRVRHDVFDDGEIEALIGLPDPDGILMHVLFATGIRKGEARRLQRKHVNELAAKVTVLNGKGGKNRVIPFGLAYPPGLDQRLADWFLLDALRPTDFLWYDLPGGGNVKKRRHFKRDREGHPEGVGEGTFQRWWVRSLATAGVRYRNAHQTRHTYATRWRNDGLAADDIQLLLGHESITTTVALYIHTTIEDVERRMGEARGR